MSELTQKNQPASPIVKTTGEQVYAQNEDSEYADLALGQIIKLNVNKNKQGTSYDGIQGLVYYYEPGFTVKIRPEGQLTSLTSLNFVEYTDNEGPFYDFDHEIFNKDEPYTIIKKETDTKFVKINNFEVGQVLFSFQGSNQRQSYYIKEVDVNKDSIKVVEIDKDTYETDDTLPLTIEFNGIGIQSKEFDVLTIHGMRDELLKQLEQSKEPIEEQTAVKEDENDFIIGEEIDLTIVQRLKELEGKDIPASDEGQRSDMITDLRRNPLPEWKGKQLSKDEYLRYVDTLMRLRNDIVEYNAAGETTKQIKPTTIDMLLQLIESGFPLSRPVLDVKLNTYVDERPVQLKPEGETIRNKNLKDEINFYMLSDIIKNSLSAFSSKEEVAVTKEINLNEDPLYVREVKNYINQYFRSWEQNGDETKQKKIKEDIDFFRRLVPEFDEVNDETVYTKTPNLNGFSHLGIDSETPLNEYFIGKVKFSMRRALKEVKGRPAENLEIINGRQMDTRGIITVYKADSAPVINHVIFPYLTTRSLGPTRSGKLLFDSYRAATCITLIEDLFLLLEGIRENPSADSIFLLKKEKENALQNIQISEYIKMILVGARGFEDYEDLFVSIGMNKYELNKDQFIAIKNNIMLELARRISILRKLREKSNKLAEEKKKPVNRSFETITPVETVAEFTTRVATDSIILQLKQEPFFRNELSRLSEFTPIYKNVDLALMAYAILLSPDYVTAVVCRNERLMAKQDIISAKKKSLQRDRVDSLVKLKEESKGKVPKVNECKHVEEYIKMKNEKNIGIRMALLKKLYDTYHKGENGNWFSCSSCKKPFMCKHEWLQIKQYMNPRESKILFKNMILNYSGGQFQGHYICKGCGQPISEIQYDDSVEFDDSGKPMMGYAPLEEDPDGKQKEIDDFNGPNVDLDGGMSLKLTRPQEEKIPLFRYTQYCGAEKVTNITILACIRNVASYIYNCIGVKPSRTVFETICNRAYNKLFTQKTVVELAKDQSFLAKLKLELGDGFKVGKSEVALEDDGKKIKLNQKTIINIQKYLNQRLIGYTTMLIFIDVQTHLPDYEIGFAYPGCQSTFNGYPMEENTNEDQGIHYMKCVLNGKFNEKVILGVPWTNTTWRDLTNTEIRSQHIFKVLMNCVDELIQDAEIKNLIFEKRQWKEKTYGISSTKEILPNSFLPVPYNPAKTANSTDEIIPEVASEQGILQLAHKLALENKDRNVVVTKNSTLSCCFENIENPGGFWLNNGVQWSGTSQPLGSKGTRLINTFSARPISVMKLTAEEKLYPRVFLKVCFDEENPHMGLPHEPGYNHICQFCGFDFKQDPATMENIDVEGKKALDEAKVEIDEDKFNNLLDSVHNHLKVPALKTPQVEPRNRILMKLFSMNNNIPYEYKEDDKKVSWKIDILNFINLELGENNNNSNNNNNNNINKSAPVQDENTRIEALLPLETRMDIHQRALETRYGSVKKADCLKLLKKESESVSERGFGEDRNVQCIDVLISLAELPADEIRNFLRTYFIIPITRCVENKDETTLENVLGDYDISLEHKMTIIRKILFRQSGPGQSFKEYFNNKFISDDVRNDRISKALQFIKRLKAIIDVLANLSIKTLHLESKNNILYKTIVKSMIFGAFYSYNTDSTITSLIRCCIVNYYLQGKKYTAEEIERIIAEREEEEKQRFIKETEKMSDQDKALDRIYRMYGIGDYAVGGTKAIWAYDKERWEKEREERIRNGQIDWQEDPFSNTISVMNKKQPVSGDEGVNTEREENF